jgi:hypothetical protein
MDPIEIFKTGTHTDSEGRTREWTEKDLEEIASSYDPAHHEAPVVIGHPETDSPAYGWVEKLEVEGGRLKAKLKELAPEFVDWVRRGLYKKISISLYPDMGLRHVGFLGAAAPAVKGLKSVAFSEKAAWDFSFSPSPLAGEDKVEESKADKLPAIDAGKDNNSKKGGKKMDLSKFFSDLKALIIGAEKEIVPDHDPSRLTPNASRFTEADLKAAEERGKQAMFAENERLKKEKTDAEAAAAAKVKEAEAKTRKDGVASFCEGLCKEGKLTPALRKIIEPVMIAVSEIPEPIEFAEGVKKSALDGIKDYLTELPKVVNFKEVSGDDKKGPAAGGTAAEKLTALTKKKMEERKDLAFGAAFAEVQKENIDLARQYLEEIGPKK